MTALEFMDHGLEKRPRRTKAEVAAIRSDILDIVTKEGPCTVRQIFYRLVGRGAISKTESEYKQTVCRLVTAMRHEKIIPWSRITDYTRTRREPNTYNSLYDVLAETAALYRRSLWRDLPERVEIWSEKETLCGVLLDITYEYGVPLMATRGYPSLTFLHAAGQEIEACGKPCYIYYFGDRDPSGRDIPRNVEQRIREFAPNIEIHFEIVAVTDEQIAELHLLTRPTKTTDTRSKAFGDASSVEVDAIPPNYLRALCEHLIDRHIPDGALDTHYAAEESEREFLDGWFHTIAREAHEYYAERR